MIDIGTGGHQNSWSSDVGIDPHEVDLSHIELSPAIRHVRSVYVEAFAENDPNFVRMSDYQRWSFVLDLLHGGSLLDVGIGVGQFVYAAARTGRFDSVTGIDIKPHSKLLQLEEPVSFVWASVADLPFPNGHFDVVTCMECLEHLNDETLGSALPELRRVTRGRLIMTVPWEEPEPLPKHHVQRFDRKRIARMFPNASITLLSKKGSAAPWALLEE